MNTKNARQEIISSSAQQTYDTGFEIGKTCEGGEVFLLIGDLGAGKTTLLQGLGAGLGYHGRINSPTFNIMKLYSIEGDRAVKSFCHLDAYRLSSGEELKALGIDEYLNNPEVITAIEWPEKVKSIWPKKKTIIEIKSLSENKRNINIL